MKFDAKAARELTDKSSKWITLGKIEKMTLERVCLQIKNAVEFHNSILTICFKGYRENEGYEKHKGFCITELRKFGFNVREESFGFTVMW